MAIDPAWIALIGTLCGGLGLKVIEHWLGKSKEKSDEATKIRDELREQIDDLRAEVRELETERDKYRNEYYDLMQKYSTVYFELQEALAKIRGQAEGAQKAVEKIDKTLPPTDLERP